MKRTLNFIKTKILMFAFALILPLTATGVSLSLFDFVNAKADTNTANYYSGYTSEKTMTNNNFSSSSSSYSISTSLSGWSGQLSDKKTTSGIINVGSDFSTYMENTFYLSKNPGKDPSSSDYKVLMINSKTSKDSSFKTARQGYKSSSVTLDANSFYSFQVAFKSDTNYDSYTAYEYKDTVSESTKIITKESFGATPFKADGSAVYVKFNYNDGTKIYYVEKKLSDYGTIATDRTLANEDIYYETDEDEFVGIFDDDSARTPIFVKKSDINAETKEISAGAQTYTCDLVYNGTGYSIPQNTKYYTAVTAYSSLNDYSYGSIYLSGLTDEDGNAVSAEYVKVSSQDWQTFYFFVATGNKSQTVSLDLWLGTNEVNHNSTGVVFFDNCHLYQYSENSFWEAYKSYKDKSYTQVFSVAGNLTEQTTKCANLINLSNDESQDYSALNFDFEDGIYTDNAQPVSKWSKSGSGYAGVFGTNNPSYFKSTTGYDYVGSDLSCKVDLDGTLSIEKNKYLLALWANDQSVKLTSGDIEIETNTIYKITANFKVCSISNGSAYMLIAENDNILSAYNLSSDSYTLAAESASSALSTNGSSEFNNSYAKVEFYVKGGALYNSSVNIALSLGKDSETATGCILFDNVKVEKASASDYSSATNKLELGTFSGTTTVSNGNFNKVEITKDATSPLTPSDWTISKETGKISYSGIINTSSSEYEKYIALYNQNKANGVSDENNPYFWAYAYASPKNSYLSSTEPDNVLMLSNISNTWQNVTSSQISLGANETSVVRFKYNTASKINLIVSDSNGITLLEAKNITSNGAWKDYEIYFKTSNSTNITLKIEFGTESEKVIGVAYFDNFSYKTVEATELAGKTNSTPEFYSVVDMTNLYQNLQTNKISEEVNISNAVAYSGTLATGNAEANTGAIVKSSKFEESTIFKIEEETNVFYFNNQNVGSYVIESKYPITLSEGYHTLSFKVKTKFATEKGSLDSSKTYNYGLTIGLKNFEYLTQVRSDDDYQTYTIFIHTTENTDTNLYLSFISDNADTCGTAVVYDVEIQDSTQDEYKEANTKTSANGYDVNSGRVYVAKASSSSEEESDNNSEESENINNSTLSDLDWSLIISGSITGLAIIIAVLFTILRKIRIGKIEKKRKEEYDRSSSLELTVVKTKAQKAQAEEIKAVQTSIDSFKKQLDTLESEHKAKVVELRSQDQGKVSKETDREFKSFAKKRAVIAEKIESLEKQRDEIKSPDHLLELERKIFAQENAQKRNLEKTSKAKNKADEKKSK